MIQLNLINKECQDLLLFKEKKILPKIHYHTQYKLEDN